MQSHAVADAPLEGSPDEPECDDAERYDTSSDNIELPTDQKVGDSSSSERADQGLWMLRRSNSGSTAEVMRLSEGWGCRYLRTR
jgi:hypothetical protein